MGSTGGVERREKSIRIHFTFQGKPCKETLKTDGEPLPPTPANLKYAHRLVAEIRDKIKFGTFAYHDYFPDSAKATTGQGITVRDHLDMWLPLQTDLADSTIKAYRIAIEFWKSKIGDKLLKALKHSDILKALSERPDWTGKTKNNKASVLRLALGLAEKDLVLKHNPIDGLDASPHQSEPPDPFSIEEAEIIIGHMRVKYGEQIADYFTFKFFTGLRTGESLAIQWSHIDFTRRQMMVRETITLGVHKKSTKTNRSRVVELNSRAMAALQRMRAHTQLLEGDWVFRAPMTGERWADDSGPRKRYWVPALKAKGIRYRSPYHTRHTYATILLMSDAKIAWAANQMGHSVEMFCRIYSKWIDGDRNALEMNKVESLIFPQTFPEKSKTANSPSD